MPDAYYGYVANDYPSEILNPNGRMNSESSRHQFNAARQAQNGNYPIYITRTAFYCRSANTGIDTQMELLINGNVYRTNTYRVNDNNWNWRWYDGGLGLYFGSSTGISKVSLNGGSGPGWLEVGGDGAYAAGGSRWAVNGGNATTKAPGQMVFAYSYQQVPTPANNVRAYSSGGTYGAVDVYWDEPSDWGDATPTGFDVWIAGIGKVRSVDRNTHGTTIGGLNPNQGYTFYVAARNSLSDTAGTSSLLGSSGSAAASARPDGVYSLRAYQNGSNQGQIDLYWDAPWGGSAAQYIDYYIYEDGQGPVTVTRNTSFSFGGQGNWQYHSFYIVAANQFGGGPGGNTAGAVSPGVPTQVYNLNVYPDSNVSGRVTVQWTPPAQTSGGIVRYTVYRSDQGLVADVGGGTTSVTLDGYTPGQDVPFDVRPWNQWGNNNGQYGDHSGVRYVRVTGHPTAPNSLTSSSIPSRIGSVQLNWSTPNNTGDGPIRFYNVYEDGNFIGSTPGDLSLRLDNRNSNVNHTYFVNARNNWNVNNNSAGPISNQRVQYVPGTPSAPLNLSATASITVAGLITLSWQPPSTIGGTAGRITRYTIVQMSSDGSVVNRIDTTATSYDITTVPKTSQSYYVVAWNDASDAANRSSPQSNSATATSNGGASQPTLLTITPSTVTLGRVSMTWLPPTGELVTYTLTRSDGTVVTKKTIAASTTNSAKYTDDGLTPGVPYTYQVQATNKTGVDGDLSDPVVTTPILASTQPVASITAVNKTNTDISGDWTIASIPSSTVLTYRATADSVTASSVPTGVGSAVDKTNVFLNNGGAVNYATISADDTTKLTIAKTGTPFLRTSVTAGLATDTTNVLLSGNGKIVTAVNTAQKSFSYTTNYPYNPIAQQAAAGTVVNTTNEVFNNGGNPVTITGATYNSFTYYIAGANVNETTAAGTATDITNRDFFNDVAGVTYYVSAILSPTQLMYERIPSNMRASLTNYVKNPRLETQGTQYVYRTNLCTNPSFEVNTTGWTPQSAVTAIRSTSFAYTGSASLLVTKSALADANSGVGMTISGLTVGAPYIISGYFRSGSGDAQPYFSITGRGSSNPITLTSTWQRTQLAFTATATSHTLNIQAGAATVATSNFYVDAIVIENSNLADSYFDGTFPATEDHSYAWTGTANASTSVRYAYTVSGAAVTANTASAQYAVGHRTTTWYQDATHSLAMVTRGDAAYQFLNITDMIGQALAPNKTYTFRATFKTLQSIPDGNQVYFSATNNNNGTTSTAYSGIYGSPAVYTFSATFNTNGFADANNTYRIWNRTSNVGSTLYIDSMMVVEGDYRSIDTFTGATTATSLTKYAWTGATDNSTSTRVTDLSNYSGGMSARTGGVARKDNPAGMDIFYRSGWLG